MGMYHFIKIFGFFPIFSLENSKDQAIKDISGDNINAK